MPQAAIPSGSLAVAERIKFEAKPCPLGEINRYRFVGESGLPSQ
jgi:hypothetical protein